MPPTGPLPSPAPAGAPGGSGPTPTGTGSGSSSGGLVGDLRAASSGAVQRISSGTQQLLRGARRLVDPAAGQPYPPPAYPGAALPPQHQQQPYQPPYQPQPPYHQQQRPGCQLSEDEALALALQRQFDLEEQQLAQQQQHQQHYQHQQAPAGGAYGPLGANLAPVAAAAAGRPSPGMPARPAAAAPLPALPADRSRCAGCGGALASMFGRSPYVNALGRCWHPGCLLCSGCQRPLAERGGVQFIERQGQLFHPACHKKLFHPRCAVCNDWVPEEVHMPGGRALLHRGCHVWWCCCWRSSLACAASCPPPSAGQPAHCVERAAVLGTKVLPAARGGLHRATLRRLLPPAAAP